MGHGDGETGERREQSLAHLSNCWHLNRMETWDLWERLEKGCCRVKEGPDHRTETTYTIPRKRGRLHSSNDEEKCYRT